MYKIFIVLLITSFFVFLDWHARFVFVAIAYPRRYGHGKSWNKAHQHYKNNWSLFERILWLFVFKERYEINYRIIAYLSYVHFILTIFSICCFFISDSFFHESRFWIYEFWGYSIFSTCRFIYNNEIGRRS